MLQTGGTVPVLLFRVQVGLADLCVEGKGRQGISHLPALYISSWIRKATENLPTANLSFC